MSNGVPYSTVAPPNLKKVMKTYYDVPGLGTVAGVISQSGPGGQWLYDLGGGKQYYAAPGTARQVEEWVEDPEFYKLSAAEQEAKWNAFNMAASGYQSQPTPSIQEPQNNQSSASIQPQTNMYDKSKKTAYLLATPAGKSAFGSSGEVLYPDIAKQVGYIAGTGSTPTPTPTTQPQTNMYDESKKTAYLLATPPGKPAFGTGGEILYPDIAKQVGYIIGKGGGAGTIGITPEQKEKILDEIKKTDAWKNLTPELQADALAYFDTLNLADLEKQRNIAKALDTAISGADPYYAEIIRIFQEELTRKLGIEVKDYESQERNLQEKIRQIQEDLTIGKGRLGIDEQAELARQARKYEVDLENLREGAAAAGLTFSTRRAVAEERMGTEYQDIRESTQRQFARQVEDLVKSASRGEQTAKWQLEDYQRKLGERATELIRITEQKLGTAQLPTLPGLPSGVSMAGQLGGVTGSLYEEKWQDILKRAGYLADLSSPFLK